MERCCVWEGDWCKGRCNNESETECKKFRLCFWVEGNESINVNPKCVIQVYGIEQNVVCYNFFEKEKKTKDMNKMKVKNERKKKEENGKSKKRKKALIFFLLIFYLIFFLN
jgi:hypothetical protein